MPAASPPARPVSWHQLPSGEPFACVKPQELEVMYLEVVRDDAYFQHGITLDSRSVVLDVGANVGMFAWHVQQKAKGARVYSFEPLPPTFAALEENVRRHGLAAVEPVNLGVADRPGQATFTFYPWSAGWSTMHPVHTAAFRDAMKENIIAYEKTSAVVRGLLKVPGVGKLLGRAITAVQLSSEQYECSLTTLSAFIDERKLDRVDLLKVDVERAELAVLQGLEDRHWPLVRQAVIEVQSDLDPTLRSRIRALLDGKGFKVVEHDLPYILPAGVPPNCMMFCVR